MPTKAQIQSHLDEQLKANEELQRQRDETWQLFQNAYLSSRRGLAEALGQSFGGDRDLYASLGYDKSPDYVRFLQFYERDGIATRVVNSVSDETWRKHPILTEKKGETPDEENPSSLQEAFEELADRLDLWSAFNEADRACGFSRFALIFLGMASNGNESLEAPATGKKDIVYVSVHDETDATVDEGDIELNPGNPRFGLPNFYSISIESSIGAQRVHHSRVVHVKEGKERTSDGHSRFYGVPRLKSVLNRLYDLEKVVGGGSEAFWMLIYRGMAMLAREGFSMPAKGSDAYNEMVDEIEEYIHDPMKRYLRLQGMDVQDLSGTPVDSFNQFRVLISYIAGSTRIPQRLLIGSEAGKLASSQDDANWSDYIDWRRENHAEPYILRPFLKKMAEFGMIEKRDRYYTYWPSLFELNDLEKSEMFKNMGTAINQASGGIPENIIPNEEFARVMPPPFTYVWTTQKLKEVADKFQQAPSNQPTNQPAQPENQPAAPAEPANNLNKFKQAIQKIFNQ